MTIPYPTKGQAFRALLLAPILPVGILFLLDAVGRAAQFGILYVVGAAMLSTYTLIVCEIIAMVIGGVTLAVLWERIPLNVFICVVVGGMVASLPFLIFGVLSAAQDPINYDAWVDGHATVVDGVKTSYGYWEDFLALLQIFALGSVGGGFFWWLCRRQNSVERTAG